MRGSLKALFTLGLIAGGALVFGVVYYVRTCIEVDEILDAAPGAPLPDEIKDRIRQLREREKGARAAS